jgi:hypothetical protein
MITAIGVRADSVFKLGRVTEGELMGLMAGDEILQAYARDRITLDMVEAIRKLIALRVLRPYQASSTHG